VLKICPLRDIDSGCIYVRHAQKQSCLGHRIIVGDTDRHSRIGGDLS